MKRLYTYLTTIVIASSMSLFEADGSAILTSSTMNNNEIGQPTPTLWNCLQYYCSTSSSVYEAHRGCTYFLRGDSIVNDTTYQKLFFISEPLLSDSLFLAMTNLYEFQEQQIERNKRFVGLLRYSNDSKKVFYRNNNVEYLLFDYSLSLGDTCTISGELDTIESPISILTDVVVTRIYERNGFVLLDVEDVHSQNTTTWIDGIGSIYGLSSFPCNTNTRLICSWHNCLILYSTPSEDLQYLEPGSIVVNSCPDVVVGPSKTNEITEPAGTDAPMYNLLGQPVGNDYRGIVIQNRKVYVK